MFSCLILNVIDTSHMTGVEVNDLTEYNFLLQENQKIHRIFAYLEGKWILIDLYDMNKQRMWNTCSFTYPLFKYKLK